MCIYQLRLTLHLGPIGYVNLYEKEKIRQKERFLYSFLYIEHMPFIIYEQIKMHLNRRYCRSNKQQFTLIAETFPKKLNGRTTFELIA